MTEKNIKLKDGEDILYPQTKIGNILNDDGSVWEEAIDRNKVLNVSRSSDGDYSGYLITSEIENKIKKRYYTMIILHTIDKGYETNITFLAGGKNSVGYMYDNYFSPFYEYNYNNTAWYGTYNMYSLNLRLYIVYNGHGPEIRYDPAYSPMRLNLEQSNFDALYKYTAENGIKIENNIIKEDIIEINVSVGLTQEDLQAGAVWKENVGTIDEGNKIWNSIDSSTGLPKKAIINISLNLLGNTQLYKILVNPFKNDISCGYNFNVGGFIDASSYLFVFGSIYINTENDTIDAHLTFNQNLIQ